MDTSEFANLVERLIELVLQKHTKSPISPAEVKIIREQIQLTKDRIQEMVDSR